ncbi:DUF3511 domain-containing protein [Citrus sinensis]|uniref:DUF3511 domain-containing protein n=1 Tax=Citrus sinensis TaxID=2711 RepID=A0ACB8MLK9_CITSI|nr:DUF3511 domain-containing protein [Citrus sinensis]KAH9786661.1 DUF3511 domain-containing protein [Citrus sinensis]
MDGYRYGSGQRPYGGDRRLEIVSVSGKSFTSAAVGGNQIYATHDLPQIPPRMPRQSHDASLKPWGFTDPEMKRRKRIAKYKVYTVEGHAFEHKSLEVSEVVSGTFVNIAFR